MPDTSWHEEVGRRVVTPQIIVAALLAGCLIFLVVVVTLVQLGKTEPDRGLAWAMNLVLVVFLIADMIARAIVPGMVVARGRQQIAAGAWGRMEGSGQQQTAEFLEFIERTGDAGRLLGLYTSRTIIAAAILEGLAFFAIIAYLLTQSLLALAVAILLVAALAFHIPTRSGVLHWIEDQLQLIDQERRS